MSDVTKETILEALKEVPDDQREGDIVSLGMVGEITIDSGEVRIALEFDDRPTPSRHDLEDAIADAVEAIEGVTDCYIDSQVPNVPPAPAAGGGGGDHGHDHGPAQQRPTGGGAPSPQNLAGVKNIIAVASGKGGVGKSTVAVNLALALKHRGHTVGLLDVDLYGPSAPILLGINAQPKVKDGQLQPLETSGLRVMSLGFLLDDDSPVIWRGPIVMGIVRQFLQDVNWSGCDYLVIDLPPGTGDTQLTLVQTVPITGALIVTTPSELSLADATRGLQMFTKVKVPVFGIVENMSYFDPPGGGERQYIFGQGGGKRTADRLGVPFMGEIPLDMSIRQGGDAGRPVVLADPDSGAAAPFMALADALAERCGASAGGDDDEAAKKGFLGGLFNR